MLVDCSIILLTFTYFYGFEKLGIQVTLLLFGGWLLVNILNYSSSNRRYISFVRTYYESIIPFTLFTVFYLGYLELFYPTKSIWNHFDSNDFVFGNDSLNKRLNVAAYPSYYVLDDHARPVAVLIGHTDETIDLLDWLIIQAKKRS